MPSPCALASLVPAPGPATTRSVLAETDPATLAPSASACALASSRLIVSSAPVNTTVLPLTGDARVSTKIGRASGRDRGCRYVSISVVDVSLKKKKNKKDE